MDASFDWSACYESSPRQRQLWAARGANRGDGPRVRAVVTLAGPVDPDRLRRAVADVIARHEILRTRLALPPGATEPVQIIDGPSTDPAGAALAWDFRPLDADRGRLRLLAPALNIDPPGMVEVVADLAHSYAGHPLPPAVQYADAAALFNDRGAPGGGVPAHDAIAPATGDATVRVDARAVAGLAGALGARPADVLLAAWAALLGRAEAGPSVTLDVISNGRPRGWSGGVGPYTLIHSLELAWPEDATFADLVHQAGRQLSLAGERASEGVMPAPGRAPEAAFEFAAAPGAFKAGGVRWEFTRLDAHLGASSPCLRAVLIGEVLRARLVHAGQSTEAVRLARRLSTLLGSAARDPDSPVEDLDLLSAGDRRAWARFRAASPPTRPARSFPDSFRAHARRHPDRVAVSSCAGEMTYGELAARAGHVAARLRGRLAGSLPVVALLLPRSPELMMGILGAHAAGAAYLPLDPDDPPDRLRFQIRDSGAGFVLAIGSTRPKIPEGTHGVGCLDDAEWRGASDLSPAPTAGDDDPAYILYTSGSTGRPKGVMVHHGGLANYLQFARAAYRLSGGGGAIVHTPAMFDLTVTSLLGPLSAGQRAILAPEGPGVEGLAEALRRERDVTLLKLTPSHLRLLERVVPARELAGRVRALVVGGEPLTRDAIEPWLRDAPATRVFNEYGPTEAVVGCCVHRVRPGDRGGPAVAIGRAIPGAAIDLVDRRGRPTPVGGAGELLIRGIGVCRGYLNRPEETARAFSEASGHGGPAGRIYRSGDLARLTAQGVLEFIGRADGQLKVGGVRVERGEVEARLAEHPGVRQAAVDARRDYHGVDRLVAYLVPANRRPDPASLRAFLERSLPRAAVPSAFVVLEGLPVNARGKVDYAALPAPGEAAARSPRPTLPRTREEAILARIWGPLLGVDDPSIDDNFFALGGHSLLSLSLVSRALEAGITLTISHVYENPTIRALAATTVAREESPALSPFALVDEDERGRLPAGLEDAYPMASLQAGMIYHQQAWPGASVYHDIFSYLLEMDFRPDAMLAAARDLAARHPALRTAFDLAGFREPMQLVHADVSELLWIEDLRGRPQAEQSATVAAWLEAEKRRGFDLRTPPLARMQIHRLSERRLRFTFSFHHALLDGWSDVRLLTELFADHFSRSGGGGGLFASPASRYAEFVALERRARRHEPTRRFWDDYLAGCRFASLPAHGSAPPDGPGRVREVRTLAVPIPQGVSEGLKRFALDGALPLKSVLLAVHARVLGEVCGSDDVTTSVVFNGRPEAVDADRVVGLFINSLPFRVRLDVGRWRNLASAILDGERAILPHRRYPLADLKLRLGDAASSDTLFYFTEYRALEDLAAVGDLEMLELTGHEASSFALVATFYIDPQSASVGLGLAYATDRLDPEQAGAIAGAYARALASAAEDPDGPPGTAGPLATAVDEPRVDPDPDARRRPAARFHRQAALTPDVTAVVAEDGRLTYGELLGRVRRLSERLGARGVGPGVLVGLLLKPSTHLVASVLAVLDRGGAFVPMDPDGPPGRLAFQLDDARPACILVDAEGNHLLPDGLALRVDDRPDEDEAPAGGPAPVAADDAAYVNYTSGSTGDPKPVRVTVANLTALLEAVDELLGDGGPGVWLSATNITFDIATLELIWPLLHGFRLVVHRGPPVRGLAPAPSPRRRVEFGLSFFGSGAAPGDGYATILEGARFADERGFSAVWTPERHFHRFGGLFPNPSLLAAAMASVTRRVGLRAGSVVLPLHSPLRVAEEWAVVDRLSGGRAGLSVTAGWRPEDFALAPDRYARRNELFWELIDDLRSLWRGEELRLPDGTGRPCAVRVQPAPVQPELPLWITAGGNPETFRRAGGLGAGVLTHLLGQGWDELGTRLAEFRRAGGHRSCLMLHTFVGPSGPTDRAAALAALRSYLRDAADLAHGAAPDEGVLRDVAERLGGEAGLIGSVEECSPLLARLRDLGVDEVACLVDFGLPAASVLENLPHLDALRRAGSAGGTELVADGVGLADWIVLEGVTHLQLTPTMLNLLLSDPASASALALLEHLLVGGEAFPDALRDRARRATRAVLWNLYGPTEATIWATAERVPDSGPVSIGRPLAGARVYLLDPGRLPVSPGETGEIYIGGVLVAAGYHGRPGLTAERFSDDPFAGPPGRIYRTGDLGRERPDGRLECLGRIDREVKVGGRRVSLDEVEALLLRHPGLAEAVVSREDGGPLVAHVRPLDPASPPSDADLRAHLSRWLPAPVLPSCFIPRDPMPRTPSGKVDRRGLVPADPDGGDAIEPRMAALWERTLGPGRVGRDDRFFDLGGNSISAVQLLARIREEFGVELSVASLLDAPTVAGLAAAVVRADAARPPLPGPETDVRRSGPAPLTFEQERLWLVERIAPGTAAYHDVLAVRLRGAFDAGLLGRSLAAVARRHEALRLRFDEVDGRPVQWDVPGPDEWPLERPETARPGALPSDDEIRATLVGMARRPFDLRREPPLRAGVVGVCDGESILLLVVHHLACDGWSLDLLLRELAAEYRAASTGVAPQPPVPSLRYTDYARWQREVWAPAELDRLQSYWVGQLVGAPAGVDLGTDLPRPASEGFRGRALRFRIDADTAGRLRRLAGRLDLTPFMAMVAAFQALLHRLTGQGEVVVGSDVANRPDSSTQGIIGFFNNQIVLRTSLEGDPTFLELLGRVRATAAAAYDHQGMPFSRLVEALNPPRDLSRNPLYNVAFTLQQPAPRGLGLPGLDLEVMPVDLGISRLDLEFNLQEDGDEVAGVVLYNTDLFVAETVERLAGRFVLLLEAVSDDPTRRLSAYPVLAPGERETLLEGWNRTARDFPSGPFHRLFEVQAALRGDATAISDGDRSWSYRTLNARANRYARALLAAGARPGDVTATRLRRGPELLATILSLSKAGLVYLPLGPSDPPARVAQVLRHSGAAWLLTDPGFYLAQGGDAPGVATMTPDDLSCVAHPEDDLDDPPRGAPAYVIYTSGSTGPPKGVVVEPEGMLNHLFAKVHDLGLDRRDVVAQTAPACFDISVWQYLAPLLVGGRVASVDDQAAADPGAWLAALGREGVTIAETVPSLLAAILDQIERAAGPPPPLAALRSLLVTGEPLAPDLCRRWLAAYPGVPLVNAYGPTECSDDVTHHPIPTPPAVGALRVPVGRPIPNVRLYILDEAGEPAPIGVAGELCVGGVAVGRGYLNDPASTAARFVPDPFGEPGGRIYRTGDRARYLAGGTVELLGRLDEQVKLRGFRIEPGEIEAALRLYRGISQAAVIVAGIPPQAPRLEAFVTLDSASRGGDPAPSAAPAVQRERIDEWRLTYERVYGQPAEAADPHFCTAGWTSSYDGRPIPAAEMEEWLDGTCLLATRGGPQDVLEIGCGLGLILFRMAPQCRRYTATDFSEEALTYVRAHLTADHDAVELLCRSADDFCGLPAGGFDLVVLNSVIQYFPGEAFLARALEGAVAATRPGGRVFVGDVRHVDLLGPFHASVLLEKAAPGAGPVAGPLRSRIARRVLQEEELAVHPDYFAHLPGVGRAEVQLKRGRSRNEMMRFRYDVVLHVGHGPTAPAPERIDWAEGRWTRGRLSTLLRGGERPVLRFGGIPNARLSREVELVRRLDRADPAAPVDAILRDLAPLASAPAEDPADFWPLAEAAGYEAEVRWGSDGRDDTFDLLLRRRGEPAPRLDVPVAGAPPACPALTNDPLRALHERRIVPLLRAHLHRLLPEYMVPASITLLDRMPVTINGKIDRRVLPAPEPSPLGAGRPYAAPRSPAESLLAGLWAEVLRLDRVGIHDNFFELGGDSITSIQIVSRASQAGFRLTARQPFEHQTIAELAAVARPEAPSGGRGVVEGPAPLTPIQAWALRGLPDPHHLNQAVVLEAAAPCDPGALERAYHALLRHHDALRLRFERGDAGWSQRFASPDDAPPIGVERLEPDTDVAYERAFAARAGEWQERLDLGLGPIARVVLFPGAAGRPDRLLVLVHHLAIDGVSWRILLADLEEAYRQAASGAPIVLPPKTSSFQEWALWLERRAHSGAFREQVEDWLGDPPGPSPMPTDGPASDPLPSSTARVVSRSLDAGATSRLLAARAGAGGAAADIMLVALVEAFEGWAGGRGLLVELEDHGRDLAGDELDLTRSVGWFSVVYPIRLTLPSDPRPGPRVAAVRDQRAAAPLGGAAFGLASEMSGQPDLIGRTRLWPEPRVAFNYFGQLDSATRSDALFRPRWVPSGRVESPRNPRRSWIEVNALVTGGELVTYWTYSEGLHREETILGLADDFLRRIGRLTEAVWSGAPAPAGGSPAAGAADAQVEVQFD